MHIVTYVKIHSDEEEIKLEGVFFGGCGTKDEAETIAQECAKSVRGGTILPVITDLEDKSVVDVMYEVEEKYDRKVRDMQEIHRICARKKR